MERLDIIKVKLNSLLSEYSERIHCTETWKQFKNFKEKYGNKSLVIIDSIYGSHEASCIWSNNSARCGPDTCICFHIDKEIVNIEKLIKRYEEYFKQTKQ